LERVRAEKRGPRGSPCAKLYFEKYESILEKEFAPSKC
jgi:hypothetical protein